MKTYRDMFEMTKNPINTMLQSMLMSSRMRHFVLQTSIFQQCGVKQSENAFFVNNMIE